MIKLLTMVTALSLAVPAVCSGQDLPDPTRLEIGRAELTRLLAQYDAVAQSTAYSDELRQEGRALADIIRERLRSGDFRSGDQIALLIEGGETLQWDTLTIEAGHLVNVPTLGPILLQGVLRSELETHLSMEIGRFIQAPRIRAHALIRVSVMGVGRPGFYTLPTDLPLSDAVMMAGGPGAGAEPGEIRIERGQDVLWSVEELLLPVASGSTLDELGLQAGDRIILPTPGAIGGFSSPLAQQVIRATLYIMIPLLLGVSIR
jgi:protein involved in polysaccharide export with SLBB domain